MKLKLKFLISLIIMLFPSICFAKEIKIEHTLYNTDYLDLGNIIYDGVSDTLTLKNANISGIQSSNDLNIILIGDNIIHGDGAFSECIKGHNITISGEGSLTIISDKSNGISANSIDIKNVNIFGNLKYTFFQIVGDGPAFKTDNINMVIAADKLLDNQKGYSYLNNSNIVIKDSNQLASDKSLDIILDKSNLNILNSNKLFSNSGKLIIDNKSNLFVHSKELINSNYIQADDNALILKSLDNITYSENLNKYYYLKVNANDVNFQSEYENIESEKEKLKGLEEFLNNKEKELLELEDNLIKKENELVENNNHFQEKEGNLQELANTLSNKETNLNQFENELLQSQSEIESKSIKLKELEMNLTEKENNLKKYEDDLADKKNKLDEYNANIQEEKKLLVSETDNMLKKEASMQESNRIIKESNLLLNNREDNINLLSNTLNQKEEELSTLESNINKERDEINKLKMYLEIREKNLKEKEEKLSNLNDELAVKEEKNRYGGALENDLLENDIKNYETNSSRLTTKLGIIFIFLSFISGYGTFGLTRKFRNNNG